MANIKIMTFNIRTATPYDGRNDFPYREELIKRCIAEESPDLIGFQEVVVSSREFLKHNLKGYTFLGCGRGECYDGEGVSVAFRSDRFELLRCDTFWLSEHPDIPGSRYGTDQSDCPRTCVATKLVTDDGRSLCFYNTHLDHVGQLSRLCAATQIVVHMSHFVGTGEAVILTGDMNALPGEASMAVLKAAGLTDLTAGLGGTYHGYGKNLAENTPDHTDKTVKIDYIFTNASDGGRSAYRVEQYEEDGIYVSDHYPVCGFVEMP